MLVVKCGDGHRVWLYDWFFANSCLKFSSYEDSDVEPDVMIVVRLMSLDWRLLDASV